jgi:hypothetical protein
MTESRPGARPAAKSKPLETPKIGAGVACLLAAILFGGCSALPGNSTLPTALPADYIPTAIALTSQAGQTQQAANAPSSTPSPSPLPVTPTETPQPSATPLPKTDTSSDISLATAASGGSTPQGNQTPEADLPPAIVQIFKPGELSRVTSPIHITSYLKPGPKGLVTIELHGEDGRLLVRQSKVFTTNPNAWANMTVDLNFEISAAAEVGRLTISVADDKGRMMALNSVNLILLSMGESDINPSNATQEAIIIEQPKLLSLVQGGILTVSGKARSDTGLPLHVELLDDKGGVVGMRLAGLGDLDAQGYRSFATEVSYKVEALTPVRLLVYEDGGQISDVSHLASLVLRVSP